MLYILLQNFLDLGVSSRYTTSNLMCITKYSLGQIEEIIILTDWILDDIKE